MVIVGKKDGEVYFARGTKGWPKEDKGKGQDRRGKFLKPKEWADRQAMTSGPWNGDRGIQRM
jgi:hypothetical protein